MRNAAIALGVFLGAAFAQGATVKVPLKDGWRFVKADDPSAGTNLTLQAMSAILDRAEKNGGVCGAAALPDGGGQGLAALPDFAWAKPEFDDSAWREVRVPHDWGVDKPFDSDLPYGDAFLDVTGVGWYRIKLKIENGKLKVGNAAVGGRQSNVADNGVVMPKNGRVYFECDGAMSYAMLYCDGKFLGGWPYGYTRWRIDLTKTFECGALGERALPCGGRGAPALPSDGRGAPALPDGEHVIAIRCHNIPHSSRWYTGGGLFRRCRLLVCPEDHVVPGSVFITTPEITTKRAKVRVRYEMSRSGKKERSFEIANPHLWDIDDPYLYTVDVEGDAYRYGIRTISFNSDERRFQLNGRTVPLNGVSMHHDFGVLGAAWNRAAQKRRLLRFKEAGVNAIRSSHNPPDEGLLELCDELGILVKDEVFDEWRKTGSAGKRKNGYFNIFDTWHERDVRAWVRTDRNHPCVIMYSLGNEICDLQTKPNEDGSGTRLARTLARLVTEEDPTRPSVNANNNAANFTNDYPTVLSVMGCNYYAWMYPRLCAAYPDVPFFGTETICMSSSRGEYHFPVSQKWVHDGKKSFPDFYNSSYCWEAVGWTTLDKGWACTPDAQWYWMDKVKTCMGEFIWTGVDYLGGPFWCDSWRKRPFFTDPDAQKKALAEVKARGMTRAAIHTCNTGFLDQAGFKKDSFWLFQSRWRPDLPMAHILPHWNWKGREGEVTPVYVFTSGDEGELFLNGKSLGRQRKQPGVWDRAYRLRWDDVRYEPGTLEVVVYKNGKEWARDKVKTTGAPTHLALEAETSVVAADGEDICYLNVSVRDAEGQVVPNAKVPVRFAVEGPGEIVATDNGDETDFDDFRKPQRKTFNGWAQAIVRAKPGVAGTIRVTVSSDGLSAAAATVCATTDLSEVDPIAFMAGAEGNLSFYISNHDQSPSHRVIHPIVGQTNFVYDAKGALEKIRGEAIAFYVRDSENVTIRNLRLDWERPCMTEATIVDIASGETLVEIDRARCPVTFKDGRLWMTGPGWTNETKSCKLFDGRTREQTAMAGDIAFNGKARELPDGRIALAYDFSKCGVGGKIGDVIAFRPAKRDFPAIVIYGSKNVVLEDVVVHDAKGMALIAQRSENIVWRGTKTAADKTSGVFPRPGAYASSHADASHFSNVKGAVKVENCWFEGMMDDAINVHSTCLAVTNVVRGDTLCCRYMHHQAVGFEIFLPGETLRFIDGDTLETGPEIRVKAVRQLGERDVEVTLETPPPDGWGVGDAVENADYQCAATFRGNVVCNNRARGTLFTTPKPVLVESNLFDKVTGSPLLFAGDDYYWYESGACRDVVIRGNVFSNCCTAASRHGYSKGVISFYPIVRDFERQQKRYHGNVLVEGNAFNGFDVPLLFAISTENIVWHDNRVTYNDLYAGWEEPPFVFKHCRNIEIDGRKVSGDTKMYTAPRCETDFNDGWEFRKEPDTAWRKVRVPHDWAIESKFDPNGEPGAGRLPYAGTGWYRKRFTLPKDAEGQSVFLDVGGAMMESDVWLNGVLVGGRKYGFSSYRVNLTSAIKAPGEENLIEIRCHVPAKSARFYFGAGLYRPLRLVRTPPVHVGKGGVFVTAKLKSDGSAAVSAQVDVKGPLAFVNAGGRNTFKWGDVRIANKVVGEDGMHIRNPKLWSPETPHLYTLETRLTYAGEVVDTVYTKFGVRTLKYDPKAGFFLNGKYRQMKGVCLHHDLGSLGAAFDRGAFERQVKIMKEMGADAIRTSHNPPDPAVLDVCDEMGMMVMDEAFDCWNRHKRPSDYATWFPEWHNKDFTDFILRDRNHPSVVMWSIGNEISDTYEKPVPARAIRTGKELTAIAHKLDPTRPVTMGHCRAFTMTNGMAKATDIYGANYLPGDYAWYLAHGEGPLGLIATETCSAVSTRGANDLTVFRKNNCLPEAEFAAQTNNPACYGEFVWTGFDYIGEPDPYTQKGARSSYYGIVDLCGFPKERYWTYRAHWRPDDPGQPEAESAEPVAKLELTQERFRDLVFVKVRAVDAAGATVTNFSDRLSFAVRGDMALAGVGNGDPMDYDSLQGDSIRAFHGLAQVILRGKTGELSVSSQEHGEWRIQF